ncbi:hypothetical protein BK011_04755 [Tenericutes bacterium MZ-XQ]|nr:hypothetical protein BK011_04755 [Tenericutes bacterium MZ-XQ]
MTKNEVLNKLSKNEVSSNDAYQMLYPKTKQAKARKARFIKFRINIPDSKGATYFINVLFALPIPIGLVKLFLRGRMNQPVSDQFPISMKEVIDLAAIKGTFVKVIAKDQTKILIKTI